MKWCIYMGMFKRVIASFISFFVSLENNMASWTLHKDQNLRQSFWVDMGSMMNLLWFAREVTELNVHRFDEGRVIGSCSPYPLLAFQFLVHRILIGKAWKKPDVYTRKIKAVLL